MYEVKRNTVRVVSLTGSESSVDWNIRHHPSPPKYEKRLIIKDRSEYSKNLSM